MEHIRHICLDEIVKFTEHVWHLCLDEDLKFTVHVQYMLKHFHRCKTFDILSHWMFFLHGFLRHCLIGLFWMTVLGWYFYVKFLFFILWLASSNIVRWFTVLYFTTIYFIFLLWLCSMYQILCSFIILTISCSVSWNCNFVPEYVDQNNFMLNYGLVMYPYNK